MATKVSDRKAILLGRHLKVLQDLGSNGVQCITLLPYHQLTAYSRYGTCHICPNPGEDEKGAVDVLYDLCRKEGNSPVLIPYSDTWSAAVAKRIDEFAEVSTPCLANREAVDLVLDKERFCKLGQERGYMTPAAWTLEEARTLADDQFPIVAKPKVHRRTGDRDHPSLEEQMDRLRVVVLKDRAELDRFLEVEKKYLPLLTFQEFVRGMSDSIYNIGLYADRSSKVLGMVCGHKIRGYPASHGDCVLGEKCELPLELVDNALRIVSDLKLSGLAEFEYKRDAETGEYRLIEINPRAWSWSGIASGCGVNLPLMAYRDLTGTYDPADFVPFPGTVKYVKLLEDLSNCMLLYGADHPPWKRSLAQWIRDIRADRVVYYDFDRRDPLPSAIIMALFAQNLLARVMGKRGEQADAPASTIMGDGTRSGL